MSVTTVIAKLNINESLIECPRHFEQRIIRPDQALVIDNGSEEEAGDDHLNAN